MHNLIRFIDQLGISILSMEVATIRHLREVTLRVLTPGMKHWSNSWVYRGIQIGRITRRYILLQTCKPYVLFSKCRTYYYHSEMRQNEMARGPASVVAAALGLSRPSPTSIHLPLSDMHVPSKASTKLSSGGSFHDTAIGARHSALRH